MLHRTRHLERIRLLLEEFPIVAILGARQVGKTTLARQLAQEPGLQATHFDLEDPAHLAQLAEPSLALGRLQGLVVLDEVQRKPDLFPLLRVLADRPDTPARFLLLGSASPDLVRGVSESLAGRIAFYELGGFDLFEAGVEEQERLWLRGGLPRSFLASTDEASARWRREFIRTWLERDLPQLGFSIPSTTIHRFWTMLAHVHGQVWNASAFGRNFGVADTTVRRYLDLLAGTFVVRTLLPWHANIGKRQVKSPKVYLQDSGLLHSLLGIASHTDLVSHPIVGASFEGFVVAAIIERLQARPEEVYFWRTHAGAELDLLVVRGQRRLGFEIKRTAAPRVTRSMSSALLDLDLESLTVIHAGDDAFPLAPGIHALPLRRLEQGLLPL